MQRFRSDLRMALHFAVLVEKLTRTEKDRQVQTRNRKGQAKEEEAHGVFRLSVSVKFLSQIVTKSACSAQYVILCDFYHFPCRYFANGPSYCDNKKPQEIFCRRSEAAKQSLSTVDSLCLVTKSAEKFPGFCVKQKRVSVPADKKFCYPVLRKNETMQSFCTIAFSLYLPCKVRIPITKNGSRKEEGLK